MAYGIFSSDGCVGGGGGEESRLPDVGVGAVAAFEMVSAGVTGFVSRFASREIAGSGQVCSWHARPMQGRPGACLGRWVGESWSLGPLRRKLADKKETTCVIHGILSADSRRS